MGGGQLQLWLVHIIVKGFRWFQHVQFPPQIYLYFAYTSKNYVLPKAPHPAGLAPPAEHWLVFLYPTLSPPMQSWRWKENMWYTPALQAELGWSNCIGSGCRAQVSHSFSFCCKIQVGREGVICAGLLILWRSSLAKWHVREIWTLYRNQMSWNLLKAFNILCSNRVLHNGIEQCFKTLLVKFRRAYDVNNGRLDRSCHETSFS